MGVTVLEREGILRAEEARLRRGDESLVAKIQGELFRTIVVCTRLDPPAVGPGVVNNWSGCVALANLFQAFRASKPAHTLVFVAFSGEDRGCRGARAYLQGLSERQLGQIDAVLSLECLGTASPAVWMAGSDEGLVHLALRSARRVDLELPLREFPANLSDAHHFLRRKVPTLFLDGLDPAQAGRLGTRADNAEWLDMDHLVAGFRLVQQVIRDIDGYRKPLHLQQVEKLLGLKDQRRDLPTVSVELGVGEIASAEPPADARPRRARAGAGRPDRPRPEGEARPNRQGPDGEARPNRQGPDGEARPNRPGRRENAPAGEGAGRPAGERRPRAGDGGGGRPNREGREPRGPRPASKPSDGGTPPAGEGG